jgi:diguanylate cyclase (GGDEF)-like protein
VDDRVAKELNELTGLEVTFASRLAEETWKLHASTLALPLRASLLASLSGDTGISPRVHDIELGSDEYETRVTRLESRPDTAIVAILQKPLEVGLAPFRAISSSFFWLTLAGLALLVAGSLVIARSITRPSIALPRRQSRPAGRLLAPRRRRAEGRDRPARRELQPHARRHREPRARDPAPRYEDGLTALPNRAMFNEQLGQAVRTARRGSQPLSVLVFDMDRFKTINDTLGHPVGDQALREVGVRVRKVLRDADIVARLGGDEFAVLITTSGTDHAARVVAGKILKGLEEPLVIDGQSMDITASIGIARFPEHGEDPNALMRAADVAMYEAKRTKAGYSVYDPTHDERRQEFLTMLGELRRAVEAGELVLHYQPKMSLGEGRVTAVEALVRWRHPQRGFIEPGQFIPFAEQTGYISAITRWVLGKAIEQCGVWERTGLRIRMSVNISARDLQQGEALVQHVAAALQAAELPAGMLCLEITESALMEDPGNAQSTLRKLRDLGIATSIDDYGTGYSSLAYIKQLAVNELKIDRAFVSGMEADRRNAAIVRSTIELGHNLGLTVVAEGVETDHELAELRRYGCDSAQGFYFARPMPAASFERWLSGVRDKPVGERSGALGEA